MSDRDSILAAIRDRGGSELPPPWPAAPVDGSLVARFEAELAALGAEVVSASRLSELAGATVFADADVPPEYLDGLIQLDDVWRADIGLTLADFGIAATGTLVLNAGPGRHRLASLAPPHHVAIVSRRTILACSDAAIASLTTRTTVFVTGPSRTADIEGVIVRGIHGPRRLWVMLTA
ncbi:MAG: LutC/YkgG family protein [Fimbriimonadaceae bacterium]